MLLRRHHKKKKVIIETEASNVGEEFIDDIDLAHELAIKESCFRELEQLKVEELKELAKEKGVENYSKMKKEELIASLAGV